MYKRQVFVDECNVVISPSGSGADRHAEQVIEQAIALAIFLPEFLLFRDSKHDVLSDPGLHIQHL